MTRLRRIALTVLVGVLVTLPTAGSAFAGIATDIDDATLHAAAND
jgi:hypothetical protein